MTATKKRSRSATPDPQSLGVGRDVLEARVATLEPSVARQPNVTSEMLADWRPGGKENPDPSSAGVLTYLCQLHRWHATGAEQPTSKSLRWDAAAIDDVRSALSATPIHLTLENGQQVGVFPKSQFALHRLAVVDYALAWVVERRLALEIAEKTAESLVALERAVAAQSRLEREFVEIVCHPGPDLPWVESGDWDPPLAAWSQALAPFDLLAIRKAYLDVNVMRLHAIAERTRALAGAGGEDAMPMVAFLGLMAQDMGVQPRELARRWSLGEVFAQALLKWEANERASQQAEQEAAQRRER